MADETTPENESELVGRVPPVPKPPRDPVVIEGEATEIAVPDAAPIGEAAAVDEVAHEATATDESVEDGAPLNEEAAALAEGVEPPVEEPPAAPEAVAPLPPSPPPPRKAGSAFGWGFSGALIGAVIVAGAALAAAWWYDPRAQALPDLSARIGAVETADAATAKTLEARLAALESGSAKAGALSALDKRLAALEASSLKPEALAGAQADARAARDAAAKALAVAISAGGDKAAPPAAPAEAIPDPRVAKLQTDTAALGDRISKLETALAAPKAETRAPQAEAPKAPDAAGQAIAAIALEQRLRAGEPYATELAALGRSGADAAALAALKPFADSGAPTSAALSASFAKATPAILAAAHPESSQGTAVDKVLENMRKLVRVHPVGEAVGEDADAVVSQVEAALARGQVSAAVGAFAKLPDAARAAAADWVKSAQARAGVDAAAKALRDGAIARLDAAKN